jgi:hypothetical protein
VLIKLSIGLIFWENILIGERSQEPWEGHGVLVMNMAGIWRSCGTSIQVDSTDAPTLSYI